MNEELQESSRKKQETDPNSKDAGSEERKIILDERIGGIKVVMW